MSNNAKLLVWSFSVVCLFFAGSYIAGYQFERGRKDAANGEVIGGEKYTIPESLGRIYLGLPDDMFGKYPRR